MNAHFLLSNNASMLITHNKTAIREVQKQSEVFNDFLLFNVLCAEIKTVNNERILKLPYNLGEKGVGFVCRVINSLTIDVLDCTSTKLGNNGIEAILSKIKHTRHIKHLILSDCNLSIEGMKYINKLTSDFVLLLDLSNNHFEPDSYDDLASLLGKPQCKIEGLNLSNNKMKPEGLGKLTLALVKYKHLKILNLKANDIGDNGCQFISEILYSNKHLSGLDVSKNKISVNGLSILSKQLCNHPSLVELNLQANLLNADSCSELSKIIFENTTIKSLNISNNKINEKGCLLLSDSLRANNAITYLQLQGNNIEDLGLKYILNALIESEILESFDISNNNLSEESSELISDFIHKNNSLISFNLANNELVLLGSISSALAENSKLEQLDLGNNALSDNEIITLCASLGKRKTLISLNISCNELTNEIIPSITNLIKNNLVIKLFLNGNCLDKTGIKSLGEAISEASTIRAFDISANNIGDDGIKDLVDQIFSHQRIQLQYINVGKNEFNKVTMKKLEALNQTFKHILFLYK